MNKSHGDFNCQIPEHLHFNQQIFQYYMPLLPKKIEIIPPHHQLIIFHIF